MSKVIKKSKKKNVKKSSVASLQRDIEQGKAPKTVARVDKARGEYERNHIHFTDGRVLNLDT